MRRAILILAALVIPSFSNAQNCSCDRVIPFSGTYRVDFQEKNGRPSSGTAQVNSIDGFDPGAEIVMIGNGGSAELSCTGNEYNGTMEPMAQAMILRSENSSGSTFGGLRMGDHFKGPVIRPGMTWSIPNEPIMPTLEFTMTGGERKATPAMCDNVKSWIDSGRTMIESYSDANTIDHAVQNKIAGISFDIKKAWPNMNSTGSYRLGDPGIITYQNSITTQASVYNSEDDMSGNAGASTHPVTCHITNAQPRTDNGVCRPDIVLRAIRAHEEVHQNRCEFVKEFSEDENGYRYWSNHPPNHSADEQEAYFETLGILEPWYQQYCS